MVDSFSVVAPAPLPVALSMASGYEVPRRVVNQATAFFSSDPADSCEVSAVKPWMRLWGRVSEVPPHKLGEGIPAVWAAVGGPGAEISGLRVVTIPAPVGTLRGPGAGGDVL